MEQLSEAFPEYETVHMVRSIDELREVSGDVRYALLTETDDEGVTRERLYARYENGGGWVSDALVRGDAYIDERSVVGRATIFGGQLYNTIVDDGAFVGVAERYDDNGKKTRVAVGATLTDCHVTTQAQVFGVERVGETITGVVYPRKPIVKTVKSVARTAMAAVNTRKKPIDE